MNKRIKKKRMKLDNRVIGDHVYSVKTLRAYRMFLISRTYTVELYRQIKNPKITRSRIKALVNYLYKHPSKLYLGYKHSPYTKHLLPSSINTKPPIPQIPAVSLSSNSEVSSTYVPIGGSNHE